MNLHQLYYFKAIAEDRSYSKAAQKMMVAQSSLSHSISKLEQELGVPLFYKEGRGIVISEYGQSFLTHVNSVIAELEQAEKDLKTLKNASASSIKIQVAQSFILSSEILPEIIRAFFLSGADERIGFSISEGLAGESVEGITGRTLDLAFNPYYMSKGVEYFQVCAEELMLVVPGGHRFAGRENVHLSELEGESFVAYNTSTGTRHYVDEKLQAAGVHVEIIQQVRNERMMASIISSGIGIGIMPYFPELKYNEVAAVRLENGTLCRPQYLMWSSEYPLGDSAGKFRDFVIRYVKAHQPEIADKCKKHFFDISSGT